MQGLFIAAVVLGLSVLIAGGFIWADIRWRKKHPNGHEELAKIDNELKAKGR